MEKRRLLWNAYESQKKKNRIKEDNINTILGISCCVWSQKKKTFFFKSFILRLIYESKRTKKRKKDENKNLILWSRKNRNNKMPVCVAHFNIIIIIIKISLETWFFLYNNLYTLLLYIFYIGFRSKAHHLAHATNLILFMLHYYIFHMEDMYVCTSWNHISDYYLEIEKIYILDWIA